MESDLHGRGSLPFMVQRLERDWRDIADRPEAPSIVEPVRPFERGEFDLFEGSPCRVS